MRFNDEDLNRAQKRIEWKIQQQNVHKKNIKLSNTHENVERKNDYGQTKGRRKTKNITTQCGMTIEMKLKYHIVEKTRYFSQCFGMIRWVGWDDTITTTTLNEKKRQEKREKKHRNIFELGSIQSMAPYPNIPEFRW